MFAFKYSARVAESSSPSITSIIVALMMFLVTLYPLLLAVRVACRMKAFSRNEMSDELPAMIAITLVLDLTCFWCCQNYPLKFGPYRPVKILQAYTAKIQRMT